MTDNTPTLNQAAVVTNLYKSRWDLLPIDKNLKVRVASYLLNGNGFGAIKIPVKVGDVFELYGDYIGPYMYFVIDLYKRRGTGDYDSYAEFVAPIINYNKIVILNKVITFTKTMKDKMVYAGESYGINTKLNICTITAIEDVTFFE